ncbi:similar to RING 1B [Actinidia rufa]|uniref:Similar to RING 1B n=1 Tax=Actinidia rufa TaxID=165716 RepID=A0A7J0FKP6_9ERIC|nr:similar to RING 1B [Actinidia rufa]
MIHDFDALIEILYEDIEKYEEEELAFHEEEKTRNKQIQASIAQILRRQSEALVTRRQKGKDAESSRLARAYTRRRRNTRGTEHEGSEDNEDENNHDGNKDSSSTDERGTEIKQRRCKRRALAQSSQPSPSAANSEGGGIDNDLEASRESKGPPSGPVRTPEMLAWGGGGARSKSVRNTRIMKLTKYLENLKENDDKYVAHETQLRAEDIEILIVQKQPSATVLNSTLDPSTLMENKVVLQVLEGQETLAGLRSNCASNGNHLAEGERLESSSQNCRRHEVDEWSDSLVCKRKSLPEAASDADEDHHVLCALNYNSGYQYSLNS